jgi:hypothetical protein
MFRRIFEVVVLRSWLNDPDASWTAMHNHQAGFRRGFSTLTHILLRDEFARQRAGKIQAFYDFRDAYNRVNLQQFFSLLREKNCPPRSQSLIYALMVRDTQNILIVNQQESQPLRRTRGFFQGSVLSCLLFNIFIDPMIERVNRAGRPHGDQSPLPHCLLFADDVNTGAATVEEAQAQADELQRWTDETGMEINLKKCGVLGLPPGEGITLCDGALPRPENYKYLGIEAHSGGINWRAYTHRVLEKAQGLLAYLTNVGSDWSAYVKLAIYKTFVRPLSDYGFAPIYHLARRNSEMALAVLETLNDIHTKALRWIFNNHGGNFCRVLSESISALAPPVRRLHELAARFYRHIQRCHDNNPIRQMLDDILKRTQWHRLLARCSRPPPLISHYSRETAGIPAPIKFDTWLRSNRIDWIESQPGAGGHTLKLHRYILRRCRRGNSLHDGLLNIPDKKVQTLALLWRQNRLWINDTCTACSQKVDRGHFNKCIATAHPWAFWERNRRIHQLPICAEDVLNGVEEDRELIAESFHINADSYHALDWMLNRQRYTSFSFWVNQFAFHMDRNQVAHLLPP